MTKTHYYFQVCSPDAMTHTKVQKLSLSVNDITIGIPSAQLAMLFLSEKGIYLYHIV